MNRNTAPSVAFIIARNGDPLTLALRSGAELDHDDLLQLNDAFSSASTSVGSSPTAVFSFRESSIVTKPTSQGTDYPVHDYSIKGKAQVEYASSLSASHGSELDAEAEHDNARRTALLGTGAWSSSQNHVHCLRREENTKVRLSKLLPDRRKKPTVVLHQSKMSKASSRQDGRVRSTAIPIPVKARTSRFQLDSVVSPFSQHNSSMSS